jgi:hypothetical protein
METLMRGSEGGGWKSARIRRVQGNSLAAYPMLVSAALSLILNF